MSTATVKFHVVTTGGNATADFRYLQKVMPSLEEITGEFEFGGHLISYTIASQEDHWEVRVTNEAATTPSQLVRPFDILAARLSLELARDNMNAHHGTPSIDYDPFEISFTFDAPGMRDALSISSEWSPKLAPLENFTLLDIDYLEHLQDGLSASNPRSKYFHWFSIIELLEGAKAFRDRFSAQLLYCESELSQAAKVLAEPNLQRKRSRLLWLKTATLKSRAQKLEEFLASLGITSYKYLRETAVTKDQLDKVIQGRNQLFHGGNEIDMPLLYEHLYPLAVSIVDKMAYKLRDN